MKMIFIVFPALVITALMSPLTPSQIEWLRLNSKDIEVDSQYQHGHWESVIEKVRDKQIIMLGEFSHGCREVFLARNDLIKAMHDELGTKVILFESGIGEMGTINLSVDERSPEDMVRGLIGPWRNAQFIELMQFVKDQEIKIGGYDIQRSGRQFEGLLNQVLAESGRATSHVEHKYTRIRARLANRNVKYDSVSAPTLILIAEYESLVEKLSSASDSNPRKSVVLRTLENRIDYLRYMLQFSEDKNWRQRWKARDEAMARNLEFLVSTFYPDEQVIVIGHNFHIAKYNEKEEVMGELIRDFDNSAIYALGIFAGAGTYASNSGVKTDMLPVDENQLDIKHVIRKLSGKATFLSIEERREQQENAWLFRPIVVNDSFIDLNGSNQLILSKHFDGVLFLDRVTAVKR